VPLDAAERYVLLSRTSFLNGRAEYDDPVYELNLRTSNLTVSGKRVEQTLDATLDVSDSVRLHPAVNLAEERIEREPDDIPLGRTHREYVRTAVGATYSPLAWVTLSALAAGECHHTGVEKGSSCDSLEPTGRAGFEIGSERLRVLANFGRYVRVPTLGEMYGVSGALHGNPDLTAETSQSVDIGVRAKTGKGPLWQGAYVDAFAFRRWAEGLIAYRRAGQGFMVPYNVGQVQISGVEILTGLKLNRIVQTEVSTTLLDPRDTTPGRTESNNVLPYRSRLIVAPRVRADWTRPSSTRNGVSGLGAEVRLLYQSSRFADPGGLGVIEQQTTVDIESHLSFFRGLLTLRGRVSDLFDSKRTDYIGYPLPGRSVYFGLEATW
jgi:iron complex outermembrane receptor protein